MKLPNACPKPPKRVKVPKRWERTRPKIGVAVPKPRRIREPEYLKYLRTLPCAVCAKLCEKQTSRSEAHHVKTRGAFGGDDTAVSCCTRHHKAWHLMGRRSFKARFGVDLLAVAKQLWKQWQKHGWGCQDA